MQFYALSYVAKAGKGGRRRSGPRRQVTNTYKRQSNLTKVMGNAIHLDLKSGITGFKQKVSSPELARAWAQGDYGKVMATIPWDLLPSHLNTVMESLGKTVGKAADMQLEALPPNVNERLRFDLSSPRIRTYIDSRTGALVTGIQAETQLIIQDAVARSFSETLTPKEVADQIKSSIGLTVGQERALANYRAGLIEGGSTVDNADELAGSYEGRLLDYRARTIARTETRNAVNNGQLAVWQEGANQGLIDREATAKEWVVDGDPCPVCEPMDGVQVGLDEAWVLTYPNGEIKYVQVPSESHPNCFCGMELRFSEEGTDQETEQ